MRISLMVQLALAASVVAIVAGVSMVITFSHVIVAKSLRTDDFRETRCHVTSIRKFSYDDVIDNVMHTTMLNDEDSVSIVTKTCLSVEVIFLAVPEEIDRRIAEEERNGEEIEVLDRSQLINRSAILYSDHVLKARPEQHKMVSIKCLNILSLKKY